MAFLIAPVLLTGSSYAPTWVGGLGKIQKVTSLVYLD